jgi:hypothetical protein
VSVKAGHDPGLGSAHDHGWRQSRHTPTTVAVVSGAVAVLPIAEVFDCTDAAQVIRGAVEDGRTRILAMQQTLERQIFMPDDARPAAVG